MPVAVPPPDRDRPRPSPRTRPGGPRRRGTAAPLRPAAVAGLALLLALATLREPAAAPTAEESRSDASPYSSAGGPDAAAALATLAPASPGAAGDATLRVPVATADVRPSGSAERADPPDFDEAAAGAIAMRMASRMAWQASGSFGVSPFGGGWSAPLPASASADRGLAADQDDER